LPIPSRSPASRNGGVRDLHHGDRLAAETRGPI
jgi:hypothetical protein